jgi:Fe-S cluster biogenesis protein NfuA
MSSLINISYENTPNPSTLKFLTHKTIADAPLEIATAADADCSPLANKIFGFPWTASVFIGVDFITVTKHDWVDWNVLAQPLANLIQEHINNNEPVVVEVIQKGTNESLSNDSAEVKKIKEILNRDIRPLVALDGGDIVFVKYENQVISLQMKGACNGCPSSTATLKEGIEVRIKELMPEVREVIAV